MNLPKTARFPARVERRRKGALARREVNLKNWTKLLNLKQMDFPESAEVTDELFKRRHAQITEKAKICESDIAALKKHLRIAV